MDRSNRPVVVLLGVLAAVAVGWVLHVGAPVLRPVIMALLLAGVLQPVVNFFRRWHVPPVVTVIALTLLLFYGLGRLGIAVRDSMLEFFGTAVTEPAGAAGAAEPGWPQVIVGLTRRIEASTLPEAVSGFAVEWLRRLDLEDLGRQLVGGGFELANTTFLVVFYLVFVLAEAQAFRRKILAAAGTRSAVAAAALDTIGRDIQRYLGVHTVVSLCIALCVYVGLLLIGLPFALLFAFLQFLLHYIPTFGSIIAGTLATATALALEPTVEKALLVAALYLVVNMVLGNYLEPKILGRELNLSPLVIILSVVAWSSLWGVAGAFLAVPLTCSLQIVLNSMGATRPLALILSGGRGLDTAERRR